MYPIDQSSNNLYAVKKSEHKYKKVKDYPELYSKISVDSGQARRFAKQLPAFTDFLLDDQIPEGIRNLAEDYVQNNPATECFETPLSNYTILKPSLASLQIKAAAYRKKYGINIEVCLPEELSNRLSELQKLAPKDPVGIIVFRENHTVPLICDFHDGRKDILCMDVLGLRGFSMEPGSTIASVCSDSALKLFKSTMVRQATYAGCRTDALTTLRNALLHIKHAQAGGMYSSVIAMTKLSNLGPDTITLPTSWCYTDQITPEELKNNPNCPVLATHQLFSSKMEKREHPETALQFRNRHKEKTKSKYTLKMEKRLIEKLPNLAIALPAHVNAHYENDFLYGDYLHIEWIAEREVNCYGFDKSFTNALSQTEISKMFDLF